jgi:hypothetical protein
MVASAWVEPIQQRHNFVHSLLLLHNFIQSLSAKRYHNLMHIALQYYRYQFWFATLHAWHWLASSNCFFLNQFSRAGCEGSCGSCLLKQTRRFVIFSVARCSQHRTLAVNFAGYDLKCHCIIFTVKNYLWLLCCMFNGLDHLR